MDYIDFNGRSSLSSENPDGLFAGRRAFSVEASCVLSDFGDNPTLACVPLDGGEAAEAVAWRLGFHAALGIPEFQIQVDGTTHTLRGDAPTVVNTPIHVAGTFDGARATLYVNGKPVNAISVRGNAASSRSPLTCGARNERGESPFIGGIVEIRLWDFARSAGDILFWHNKILPHPLLQDPPPLATLANYRLRDEEALGLRDSGVDANTIGLVALTRAYHSEYLKLVRNKSTNSDIDAKHFRCTLTIILICTDGIISLSEPEVPPQLREGAPEWALERGATLLLRTETNIRESIAVISGGEIIVLGGPGGVFAEGDRPSSLCGIQFDTRTDRGGVPAPTLLLDLAPVARVPADGGTPRLGRLRVLAPLYQMPDGTVRRAYSWIAADIWPHPHSPDLTHIGLAEALAARDLLRIEQVHHDLLPGGWTAQDPIVGSPASRVVDKLESLLQRPPPDAREAMVAFMRDPVNRSIIWPTAEATWCCLDVGAGETADVVVKDAGSNYSLLFLGSPVVPIFADASESEPSEHWTEGATRAERATNSSVRNAAAISAFAGLREFEAPKSVLVIGRKSPLTQRKVTIARSAKGPSVEVETVVYDTLVEQAKNTLRLICGLEAISETDRGATSAHRRPTSEAVGPPASTVPKSSDAASEKSVTDYKSPPEEGRSDAAVSAPGRLADAKRVLSKHASGRCPKCDSKLNIEDALDDQRDCNTRTWSCNKCGYTDFATGIPVSHWTELDRDKWYAKVASQRAKEVAIRCPDCGNDSIAAREIGSKVIGPSSHLSVSCSSPGCELRPRDVERSIPGTGRALTRQTVLWVILGVGAILVAGVARLVYGDASGVLMRGTAAHSSTPQIPASLPASPPSSPTADAHDKREREVSDCGDVPPYAPGLAVLRPYTGRSAKLRDDRMGELRTLVETKGGQSWRGRFTGRDANEGGTPTKEVVALAIDPGTGTQFCRWLTCWTWANPGYNCRVE